MPADELLPRQPISAAILRAIMQHGAVAADRRGDKLLPSPKRKRGFRRRIGGGRIFLALHLYGTLASASGSGGSLAGDSGFDGHAHAQAQQSAGLLTIQAS